MANTINADNGVVSTVPGLKYSADTSGELILQTNTTNALTLDTTQGATFSTGALVTNPYAGSYSSGMVLDHTTSLGRISVAASSAIAFYNGGISARVETMRIDSAGNVGIGTASPSQKLAVSGAAGSGAGSIAIGLIDTTSSKNIQLFRTGTTYSYSGIGGGEGVLYNLNSNLNIVVDGAAAIKLNTNGSERMRIDSSGNVLVGTTSNSSASRMLVAGGNFAVGTNGTSPEFQVTYDGTNAYLDARLTGGGLIFRTNGSTERMRIDSLGNVGIGATAASNTRLYVSGGRTLLAANNETYSLCLQYTTSGVGQAYIGATNSATPDTVFSNTAGTERMRLTSDGRLGINISGPAGDFRMSLSGDDTIFPGFVALNATVSTTTYSTSSLGITGTRTAHPFVFLTNGAERMRIDGSGKVGIGTSSPSTYNGLTAILQGASAAEGVPLSLVNSNSATGTSVSLGFAPNVNIDLVRINALRTDAGFGGATDLLFNFWNGASIVERLRFTSTGNIRLANGAAVIQNSSGRTILNQTGGILQVVTTFKNDLFSASVGAGSFTDITGFSATITPSSTSSRILVLISCSLSAKSPAVSARLLRNGTLISNGTAAGARVSASTPSVSNAGDGNRGVPTSITFVDSPASTSALTYKLQIGLMEPSGSATCYFNTSGADDDAAYTARTASSIVLLEIAG